MAGRRRILLAGLALFAVGLVWMGWAWSVGLEEMHVAASERTDTQGGIAVALMVSGILAMVSARFARKDR